MKNQCALYVFLLFFVVIHNNVKTIALSINTSAITIDPKGGRLGDQIFMYSAAKYLSIKQSIPFFCAINKYLDQLILDEKELFYSPDKELDYDRIEMIVKNTKFDFAKKVLYKLPVGIGFKLCDTFLLDSFRDKEFLTLLKLWIRPKKAIVKVAIPENVISVAVHVRKGSGSDVGIHGLRIEIQKKFPTKFPSDHYYIDQIRSISHFFKHKKIYVHLFTDYSQPLMLQKEYASILADKSNIFIGCTERSSLLDDLFSMVDFDCFIRPHSHFSRSAELIGNHKLILYPKKAHWDDNLKEVIVDNVEFYIKDPGWCQNAKK